MLWIITADHISERVCLALDEPVKTHVGVVNAGSRSRREIWYAAPIEARDGIRTAWIEGCDYEFRLYDDDGELYYEGVCYALDHQDGDSAFEPLDWAEKDGCTRMDYRKKGDTEWVTL